MQHCITTVSRTRTAQLKTVAPILISFACALGVVRAADAPRPDALLQIDMNRAQVVERIVLQWGHEVSQSQRQSLKSNLLTLRADHLLAASLTGTFDGVLEIVQGAQAQGRINMPSAAPALASAASAHANATDVRSALETGFVQLQSTDQSKALGETERDLVYTPVTPCRLFDTRTGQASALGTVGGAITNNSSRLISAGGACGIPAAGVRGIMLSFHSSTNNPPVLGIVSFKAPGAPVTAMAATWTGGVWVTGTFVAPTNATSQFDVYVGNNAAMQADFVSDVVGYFMPPNRNGNGLRIVQTTGTTADAPNVTNGSANNLAGSTALSPSPVVGATVGGGGYAGTNCLEPISESNGGRCGNQATGSFATVAGGSANWADGFHATVVGGESNVAGNHAFVGGGAGNYAGDDYASITGGSNNKALAFSSAVGGGSVNITRGVYSVVPGGQQNQANADRSFAAGREAIVSAANFGTFIWADSNGNASAGESFTSSANDQFAVRARGGVAFRVASTTSASSGAGCSLPAGGAASFTCSSDRNLKEAIKAISPQSILAKVTALPLTTWQFIGTDRRHLGPMAQDFRAAFGLGMDDVTITTSDVSGVALAAIQGLNEKLTTQVKAKDAQLAAQAKKLSAMERELAAIKKKLGL